MKKIILLYKASFKREYILFKRYLAKSLGGILTFYVVFLIMFLGYQGIAGNNENFGNNIEGLIVSYLIWMFALGVFQDVTSTLMREAREGTLEQLYMSVFGFGMVIGAKTVAKFVFDLIVVVVMLFAVMFTTGKSLNLDVLSLLPLLIFTLMGFLGFGFLLGGLAVIFKMVGSYLEIFNFIFIAFIAVPVGKFPLAKLLPGNWGTHLIQEVMTKGKSILNFSLLDIGILIVVGLIYLFIGYGVYKVSEKAAMKKGLLGHY